METSEKPVTKLVVVGLSTLHPSNGSYLARDPVVEYLHEQSTHFEEVVHIGCRAESDRCTTPLDTDRVTPVPLAPRNPLTFMKQSIGLASIIDDETAVIVQAPYTPALPLLPAIRTKANTVVGYMASNPKDVAEQQRANSGLIPALKSRITRLNGPLVYRFSDRLLVRGEKHDYENHHADVTHSNPIIRLPDVETDEMTESDAFDILYVGSLHKRKGVSDLIRAIDELLKEGEYELRVTIVGKGDREQELRKLVFDLNLEKLITFHGWIDNMDTVAQFYTNANALVVPSRAAEGSPRVIDEGHYYGVPIVASDLGYDTDLRHGENVLFFQPESTEGLVDALETLLTNEDLRARLISAGKERMNPSENETAAKQHSIVVRGKDR